MQPIASVPFTEIASFPALITDYLRGEQHLTKFYKYPFSITSFAQVIADKSKQPTDRKTLHAVLKKQYSFLENTTAAETQIHSILNENTFTVTAAHQPCLFFGPVFNVYKIAATIHLARQLKAAFPDKHFVPVFWMGSEDHDWEELGNTYVYGKKLEWQAEDTEGPVGRISTTNFAAAINELENILGPSGTEVIAYWTQLQQKHTTFGTLLQQYIHDLFQKYGLLVLNQDDADLKRIFLPVIKKEVFEGTANELLQPHLADLSRNYKLQVTPREINFFYLQKNSRKRVVRDGAVFRVMDTDLVFSAEKLMLEIDAHPERFSPNVVMRPLYQEMVLPNLAFVGGAGELSYWLELKPLLEHFGVNFPMLAMRPAFTVLNASQQKKWQKLGLPAKDWFGDIEAMVKQYVMLQSSADLSLTEPRQKIEMLYDQLAEKAAAVDVTLRGAVEAEKQKTLQSLAAISGKLLKAEKKKQEDGVNQIRNLQQQLFPNGNWQERSENLISFQMQHPDFIDSIIELADPFKKALHFIS